MKRNIITVTMLVCVLALASCATQQLASNQKVDDDVYYTKAKAGEQIDMPVNYRNQDVYADPQSADAGYGDDDYYYYDSYASRINRFNYASPFNYYDDYYYDYTSPTTTNAYGYGGYGLNSYAYGGYGLGFGLGLGFGYGGYYGYSPFGLGYGGGYPYWGIYSAYGYGPYGYGGYGYGYGGYYGGGYGIGYGGYGRGTARPFRGTGQPGGSYVGRSARGYNGAYPNSINYPGRSINSQGRRVGTNGYGNNGYNGQQQQGRQMRPARTDYPTYQQPRSTNSMPSSMSSGGGMSTGGGGGGGGRPGRP